MLDREDTAVPGFMYGTSGRWVVIRVNVCLLCAAHDNPPPPSPPPPKPTSTSKPLPSKLPPRVNSTRTMDGMTTAVTFIIPLFSRGKGNPKNPNPNPNPGTYETISMHLGRTHAANLTFNFIRDGSTLIPVSLLETAVTVRQPQPEEEIKYRRPQYLGGGVILVQGLITPTLPCLGLFGPEPCCCARWT